MTSFHCPNCQRGWHQGVTRDHQETWCWVCQGNAHQTTTEERDLYRDSLKQIMGVCDPSTVPYRIAREALKG